MTMGAGTYKKKVLIAMLSIASATIILQMLLPEYQLVDVGFLIAILITYYTPNYFTILMAATGAVSVFASAFYFHHNSPPEKIITDHLYSFLIMPLFAWLVIYARRIHDNLIREKMVYSNLFEHAAEGLIMVDENASMVLVNPAAQQIFGYSEDELTGRNIAMLIPKEKRLIHRNHHKGYYKNPQTRKMGEGLELYGARKDGTEFPVAVSLNHFKIGNETYVLAFIIDITDRKKAEEQMRKANKNLERLNEEMQQLNEELEEKVGERTLMLKEALRKVESSLEKEKELSDIKSRFVSMASHEFRTPLSTILFSTSLLSKYPLTNDFEKREKHIHKINNSVRHLNAILEDFLSLGRINEGGIQPSYSEFNLKDTVKEITEEMKDLMKEGQDFNCAVPDDLIMLSDEKLLKNILFNIIGNAIKYSPEKTLIDIEANNKRNFVELTIRDTGIGISKEDQRHLFTSFFRGRNVASIKGTGLGLYIVKSYLNLLGGKICLNSLPGEGTIVTIQLPNELINHEKENPDH